jgi:hypothetical protein
LNQPVSDAAPAVKRLVGTRTTIVGAPRPTAGVSSKDFELAQLRHEVATLRAEREKILRVLAVFGDRLGTTRYACATAEAARGDHGPSSIAAG